MRKALETIPDLPHKEACESIAGLETQHKERREWVWARVGKAPLARALEPLARLAAFARTAVGGVSVEAMASEYATRGWCCDRAAMDALAFDCAPADAAVISRAVRSLYEPWLEKTAHRFQEFVAAAENHANKLFRGVAGDKDTCILFVDGLRFDIGGLLHERLESDRMRTRLTHRLAPLPTVTATAKPLATPVHAACIANPSAEDFTPLVGASGKPATAPRLRAEMTSRGVYVIEAHEIRFASSAENGGWAEIGRLDEIGHALGARLAREIKNEVEVIVEHVAALLNAGWTRVRVVTDHGWLLLPGGLPKVELPRHLVATKWARCAAVRGESSTAVPTFPWYWNAQARIASPPGIGSFVANTEYAHGGVSLQECVVPELIVERAETAVQARIVSISWRGMRCRVAVNSNATGLSIDLRLNWRQVASSIANAAKRVDGGDASLVIDDRYEGSAATVVLLDAGGSVLDYKSTTVGEQD